MQRSQAPTVTTLTPNSCESADVVKAIVLTIVHGYGSASFVKNCPLWDPVKIKRGANVREHIPRGPVQHRSSKLKLS